MPQYRRRETIVTAEQFDAHAETWPDTVTKDCAGRFYVATPSGPIKINDRDWIVTHSNGMRLAIRPAIFAHMYEAVDGPVRATEA